MCEKCLEVVIWLNKVVKTNSRNSKYQAQPQPNLLTYLPDHLGVDGKKVDIFVADEGMKFYVLITYYILV